MNNEGGREANAPNRYRLKKRDAGLSTSFVYLKLQKSLWDPYIKAILIYVIENKVDKNEKLVLYNNSLKVKGQ